MFLKSQIENICVQIQINRSIYRSKINEAEKKNIFKYLEMKNYDGVRLKYSKMSFTKWIKKLHLCFYIIS